jgi:DNA-directed RNA polymerase specialized sigma24 family protein
MTTETADPAAPPGPAGPSVTDLVTRARNGDQRAWDALVEHELLAAERQAALREALLALPPCCQQLITLLIQDPPVPYARISATLGIPVGGIGPTRRRCLDKLRRHPAIAALISADPLPPGFGP